MFLRFTLFLICLLLALPARADNNYVSPSFDNLARTLVRFNALDLKEDWLLDEYAMITDCELFEYYFPNDFKWNQVRAAIRESVRVNIATYPTEYHYDTKVQLGRYDFKLKNFRFSDRATIRNVNTFLFYEDNYRCGMRSLKHIPSTYHAVLDTPVSISGLPFAENDAKALLQRMELGGNKDHVIYARFQLRVVNINPLRKIQKYSETPQYSQNPKSSEHEMRFDVRLDGVNFYEDEDMTRLIYSYRP